MANARFIFCVHNHQPVDNFDHVFRQAYDDAYLPFIEAMERHPAVKFCAHYSGPLLEWIEKNRPGFFTHLRKRVEEGRLELLGGGFYEPIFSMLPEADALGQIEMMSTYLRKHFGAEPQGLWMAERIWEPHLAGVLAKSGLRYAVLDDFHFRAVGLRDEELHGYYVTEHDGELFNLFPIKEELRYAIPYREPKATLDCLRRYPEGSAVVYADDGEKFGIWPESKKHTYEDGWLERFLKTLEEVPTTTFAEALKAPPRGRIYLPACSYREMGEWVLLTQSRDDFDDVQHELKDRGKHDIAKPFLVGGLWRNFRVKYAEANLMYGRMLGVSKRVAASGSPEARRELYRGQCNCGYWHGFFGGLYLPLLREAIYRHLIAAEEGMEIPSVDHVDLDLDGRKEVRLTNPELSLFLSPTLGGQLLELDVRPRRLNLGATLTRRREHYHKQILQRVKQHEGKARSIHDRVVTKRDDLDQFLTEDRHQRTSLVDHFFSADAASPDCAADRGDFATGAYSEQDGSLVRDGVVDGVPVRVEKTVRLAPLGLPKAGSAFEVAYTIRASAPLATTFAVELNLLVSPQEVRDAKGDALQLEDTWHDLKVALEASKAEGYWLYPIQTVSSSEGGFELNHQGMAVVPRWRLRLEAGKSWSGGIRFRVAER